MTSASIPITVVIPTKNEEVAISHCISSVAAFDEIIVVDSNSTDATQSIAASLGARVVNYTWDGKYPKKKQWCLDTLAMSHEWVLFIDADETPSPGLIRELRDLCRTAGLQKDAYDIRLDYWFMGRRLKHGHQVVKRALVRRGGTHFPPLSDLKAPGMGEQEGHYQPIPGPRGVSPLAGTIIHSDPDPFNTWIARHNRYSDWEAYLASNAEVAKEIRSLRSEGGRRFANTPLKPLAFFIYSYILRLGFLDGTAGFNYAIAHAFYFWMIDIKTREARSIRVSN